MRNSDALLVANYYGIWRIITFIILDKHNSNITSKYHIISINY